MSWDCIVVGGGAAGLSAALVLGRARRRTLVLDPGGQSNLPAHGIGGLLGHDGRPPAELYALGRDELARYPTVEVRDARAAALSGEDGAFVVALEGGGEEVARRVLLATGAEYAAPELPGIAELWGDTVFHCPFCHGWEARDGRLAVHGSAHAAHRALLLRGWSDDVVVLAEGPPGLTDQDRELLERAGVPIEERRVVRVRAEGGRLAAVVFADGDELALDGLLVGAPLQWRTDLATAVGAALTATGALDVDEHGQTTVPGLWAAGDVGSQMPNVARAIHMGHQAAAMVVFSFVVDEHGIASPVPPRSAAQPA
ncbi:NAD(P)/FAD-dependent oxidoreductase [Conexibacter sp. SYSU D00693]|uniref:NAD(P)/FAD-dependent oxidoreductase n=1 Tax=Conexibacter sp. SYSU D00693 TaxID=2812560 RepID=UPI001F11F7A6|nr:NAD(P)/FAD-dependent oxidoreductase [Conexibacter sp. SYSU D00693]